MAEKIPTILIIGAGPGGLSLYHSIQKNLNQPEKKFNVRIFERERGPTDRWQGHNISINKNGIVSLLYCLPSSLQSRLPEAIPNPLQCEHHRITIVDETGNLLLRPLSKQVKNLFELPSSHSGLDLIISYRNKLRDLLLDGVNVEWGKRCIGYEEVDDGIWVIFEDGSKVFGDFVVASDGINSPIRKQKIPEFETTDLGVTGIVVDIAPSKKLIDKWMPYFSDSLIQQSLGPNGDTSFSLIRRIPVESDIENKSDDQIHYRMTLSYFYNKKYDNDDSLVSDDNSESLVNHVINTIEKLRPPGELRDLIIELWKCVPLTTPENYPFNIFNAPRRRPMRDINPLAVKPWRTTRVTLLGDAVHAMNPIMGLGTNRVLQNVTLLTKKLGNFERDGWKKCFKQYEQEMRIKSSVDVLMSRYAILSQTVPLGHIGIISRNLLYRIFNWTANCKSLLIKIEYIYEHIGEVILINAILLLLLFVYYLY